MNREKTFKGSGSTSINNYGEVGATAKVVEVRPPQHP